MNRLKLLVKLVIYTKKRLYTLGTSFGERTNSCWAKSMKVLCEGSDNTDNCKKEKKVPLIHLFGSLVLDCCSFVFIMMGMICCLFSDYGQDRLPWPLPVFYEQLEYFCVLWADNMNNSTLLKGGQH